ncbi:Uncharacterized protein TCAP_06066 [Tolypocladium capitatum]|uniref:Uncharacterized protein n=1 Tax=Tolypocladium capitatum TaxID=45235 RepID=A0A2K3Q8Y8_9HYPO|nr:Uncharacterized protein TCAP_06066 [Tolypocladium capitatum]
MKDSTGASSDAPASWLSSFVSCCTPLASYLTGDLRRNDEKEPSSVAHCQPPYQPRPLAVPETESFEPSWRERMSMKSAGSRCTSFSVRSRLWSDESSRRPLISAPSDFRHLNSGSFQFPQEQQPPPHGRRSSSQLGGLFLPLELSIYVPDSHTSPILPHSDCHGTITPPPPAYFASRTDEDHPLVRQRSYSSMSFHIPRRRVTESSPPTVQEDLPPRIPPKAPGRARAYTAPDVEAIKERVASGMIEVERLQKKIEDIMERQSLYMSSRPSTSHSMAWSMPKLKPMPSIPALPPAAPSFFERLNSDLDRPHTAPIKRESCLTSRAEPSSGSSVPAERTTGLRRDERPPPPPLPLVLRPPLRKKKSFSRVSTWLFPGAEQSSDRSIDTVTNSPRPVKGGEGFYQCIAVDEARGRQSFDSLDSSSTRERDDEQRTAATTWSPGSTPVTKAEAAQRIERRATFGKDDITRWQNRV